MKRLEKCLIIIMIALILSGCGSDNTKVVFHTGFEEGEVFKIDNIVATLPEMMVYLCNMQKQYEEIFSDEIWQIEVDGTTLEEDIKDIVLARFAQVKTMNLLAVSKEIELSEEELLSMNDAANEYYSGLTEEEISMMQITLEIVEQLYKEYAIAHKLHNSIIEKDINLEVSDDEARTITVEHILVKTFELDSQGEKVAYTEEAKREAYERALEIQKKAVDGDEFKELMELYNEDIVDTYSFRKGEKDIAFENASFKLGKDDISDVIETESGYQIIKCINTYDKEQTDANKIEIMEQRKEEVFNEEYNSFVLTLTKNINTELWDSVQLMQLENTSDLDFFLVYEKFINE